MTQFYIDADNGNDGNTGLGPLAAAAWATLDKFTEATRSPGDIVTLRRGTTAQYDDGSLLNFTSDGTFGNPIIIEADYDDVVWTGGPDFVNSSQTYTMVFGSKTHTASATITGIVAGDWVFNTTDGDDPREFSYEVASVSGTTLTLHLPWKGSTGATKTLKVMPANPVHGDISAHTGRVFFSGDEYWKMQGVDILSTVTGEGIVESTSNSIILVKDCHINGQGTTSRPVQLKNQGMAFLRKVRTTAVALEAIRLDGAGVKVDLRDVITTGETSQSISRNNTGQIVIAQDCEFFKAIEVWNVGASLSINTFGNCTFIPAAPFSGSSSDVFNEIGSQDHDGVVGNSYLFKTSQQHSSEPGLITDETTTVRFGGSNTSLKITPHADSAFSTVWELSREILLEIPIFTDTTSRKYEIFMRPDLIASWTDDPTAAELWLEGDFWGHPTNNFRKLTRSTGVLDFNGSDAWQSLDVTVAPSQQGLGFLRVWWAKPKESGKTNVFFIDPKEVVT